MASEIKVDTISEKTSAGGVTIDGLLIKDGGISGDVSLIGTTPTFTIGDSGAEDAALVFDGNAQDFYIALDDSADDLVIGLGSTVGTTPAISINSDRDVTISDGAIDFDVASHDTSNGLKLGGTLVTATAAEINLIDGGTARGTTALADGDGILINDGGTMRMTNVTTVQTYMQDGAGISEADQWRVTANFEGSANYTPIASNWERNDTSFDKIGTGMTESSGLFTFPSTGIWLIHAQCGAYIGNIASPNNVLRIRGTANDWSSNFDLGQQHFYIDYDGDTGQSGCSFMVMFDVTNTTNNEIYLMADPAHDDVTFQGSSDQMITGMTFIKLGAT